MSSAADFYLQKGFTPKFQYQSWAGVATTLAIFTPTTGTRVALTGLTISNNAAAGTLLIVFDNTAATKIAEFTVGASLTIAPFIQAIESTGYDIGILARPSTSATAGGWRVTAYGFELP